MKPAIEYLDLSDPKVQVTILAGIGPPHQEEWTAAKAGWYIICNGRVVVSAEKTDLTGWGTKFLPQFHSGKHRAFLGLVFFSENPAALPWTTTKRSINRDSISFQKAQPHMAKVGKEVLAFINRWYPSEPPEEPGERQVAVSVQPRDLRSLAAARQAQAFSAQVDQPRAVTKVRIQFDVTPEELGRARRCLGRSWSGVKIGRHAFDYFLRKECGND